MTHVRFRIITGTIIGRVPVRLRKYLLSSAADDLCEHRGILSFFLRAFLQRCNDDVARFREECGAVFFLHVAPAYQFRHPFHFSGRFVDGHDRQNNSLLGKVLAIPDHELIQLRHAAHIDKAAADRSFPFDADGIRASERAHLLFPPG